MCLANELSTIPGARPDKYFKTKDIVENLTVLPPGYRGIYVSSALNTSNATHDTYLPLVIALYMLVYP